MSSHAHHEDDDHDHHEHAGSLKGIVTGIFAPHSHDAADSIDTALESSERGIRAVKISFVAAAGVVGFIGNELVAGECR
jgi:hypothetical protein